MAQRYHISIQPHTEQATASSQAEPGSGRTIVDISNIRITINTPDGPSDSWLVQELQREAGADRLTIVEGYLVDTGSHQLLQSGSYNRIVIDASTRTLHLDNDTSGMIPCFYAIQGDTIHISNSQHLMRGALGSSVDELGFAEMYLLGGWQVGDRTLWQGVYRIAPGTHYRFDLDGIGPPETTRLANTWTAVNAEPLPAIVDNFRQLWNEAFAAFLAGSQGPIGLFLSGGLDSRLVAGALRDHGRQIVAMTHGDVQSDEARIAGMVAAAVEARWLTNAMDDSFTFDQLALEQVHLMTEALFNPMWHSSGRMLVDEGVVLFSTGAGLETGLGGERSPELQQRLANNLRNALVGPLESKPVDQAGLEAVAELHVGAARKRLRNYASFLAEPYRSWLADSFTALKDDVSACLQDIARTTPTLPQVRERFTYDHKDRQLVLMQSRQLAPFGVTLLPSYDRDLLEYLTNLQPGVKYDHHLYYHVIRRIYPDLAQITVTNLGTGVNKHQLRIETERAWRIIRKQRLAPWVNFDGWMRQHDRLERFEQLFLDKPTFFDAETVDQHFEAVRNGQRSIYDGNELLSFLNLSWLLDGQQPVTRKLENGAYGVEVN